MTVLRMGFSTPLVSFQSAEWHKMWNFSAINVFPKISKVDPLRVHCQRKSCAIQNQVVDQVKSGRP